MTPATRNYIDALRIADDPIKYEWDDSDPKRPSRGANPKLMDRISDMSTRAQVSLSAAFVEWMARRLSKQVKDHTLFHLADALYASTADWRYLAPLNAPDRKLDWKDWKGAKRGPIVVTYNLVRTIMEDAPRGMAIVPWVVPLSNIVEYVLSDPKRFREWRRGAIERLVKAHPWKTREPLGLPVPPEALDPDFDYKPQMAPGLMEEFLATLDYRANPFLQSPAQMGKAGFDGIPYGGATASRARA